MTTAAADTIAAIATAAGRGGIAVLRISGPDAARIASSMLRRLPAPRHARFCTFRDDRGRPIDEGIALYFPAPASFTGEDVVELQGHGGPMVADSLLAAALMLGARAARPGEFTERAFLNGKLDLAQAEAVADLIDAASHDAAQSALRSLRGEFSARVGELVSAVTQLRVQVEAAIDFPEEEIDFLADAALAQGFAALDEVFNRLLRDTRSGCALREGLHVVLTGPPNVGKSSLLNRLSQSDRAIVSTIPGTTRDLLEQTVTVGGMPVQLIDTAGLRETVDEIEVEGVRRAREALRQSDLVLFVVDDTEDWDPRAIRAQLPADMRVLVVVNKIDLSRRPPGRCEEHGTAAVALSALTGAGIDALRSILKERAGCQIAGEGGFTARRRHVDALERARACFERARVHARGAAGELMAEELRLAQQALSEISGEFTSDDLLGEIFSAFCIGK